MATTPKGKAAAAELDDDVEDFDIPLAAEAELKPFQFKLGGQVWELPHFSVLPLKLRREIASGISDPDMMRKITGSDELAELLDELPIIRSTELVRRYLKKAGLGQGESQASTGS